MTEAKHEFPYPLVTTEWLADRLDASDIKIVDASWRMPGAGSAIDDHQKRRLPRAVFFDLDEIADHDTTLPHMLPPAEKFAAAVGRLGISETDSVIVYDDVGVFSAARVWWTFRAMGHPTVSVLDGGLPKWSREGRSLETGMASPAPVQYAASPAEFLARNARNVRNFLARSAGIVLDARPSPRFLGAVDEPRPNLRRGHMPDAVSLPHSLLISEAGELRPLDQLAKLFRDRDVHADTEVITTCGSGVTAAVLSLALERLGHRRHALYDGSWTEWGAASNDPALFPVVTG